MAGHSHWSNIRHKKAKTDSRRGKVWGKCAKAIMVAARHGLPDPAANLALRYAVEEAKAANMPRDTIERAIKKGSGEIGGEDWQEIRYEAFGPGGVALIIDALTNNRTRTVGDVRMFLTKYGGNLAATNGVSYMFEQKGRITLDGDAATEDQLMTIAIEAGAEDVALEDDVWTVLTSPADYIAVKEAIDKSKLKIESAELAMLPTMFTELAGDNLAKCVKMIEALEDNDDVQKVYTNLDASAKALEEAMK
jgi:YebC/PmpR family DNA-binding regulatory protein